MKKADRIDVLKAMHSMMENYSGDEEAYYHWVSLGVPDCPSEDDYDFIADTQKSFEDCVKWWAHVVLNYI